MKIEDCDFPKDLLYDVPHGTWAKWEDDNLRVGITGVLAWASGPIHKVTFKPIGTEVQRGNSLGSFEGARLFDVVRSPVSGVLSETNDPLITSPRLLNRDFYGSGWFAKIRPKDVNEAGDLSRLPPAEPVMAASLRERRVHCFAEFPDREMFEIGVECSAVLVRLNELITESPVGTVVHVVSDDNTADIEMERWSMDTGNPLIQSRRDGNLFHFIVKKKEGGKA